MQIRANANENQVINVSSAARARAQERSGINDRNQQRRKTIFMGDLNVKKDAVTQRKMHAQQKALKMIGDAWDGDRKIDRNIQEIRDMLVQLHEEKDVNLEVIAQGEAQKEELRQQYGVAPDSREQKDLELLEKNADALRHPDEIFLTEEEKERLKEIKGQPPETEEDFELLQRKAEADEKGLETAWTEEEQARLKEMEGILLTEYQKRCMEIDTYQQFYEKKNDLIDDKIEAYNGSVRAIRQERLKFHEMVNAQKKADAVMEAASKEAVGMLMEEAKDHVDEELEEKREEAEEKVEEKAEEEEKIEERNEEQEELENRIDEAHAKNEEREELRREAEERSREDAVLLGDMMEAGMGGMNSASNVQTDVKNMLHKMKLLEEDLKGSIVDEDL